MTTVGFPFQFDKDVSSIIATFLTPKQYKFLDWIDTSQLNSNLLCSWLDESLLFSFIKSSLKLKINCGFIESWEKKCYSVSENPNAINIIELILPNLKNWSNLAINPNAIHILQQKLYTNIDKIDFINEICYNPNAIPLIEWYIQQSPKNLTKLNWYALSYNPNAIHLLQKYPKQIIYGRLVLNSNPIAMTMVEEHIEYLIEQNMKIEFWSLLHENSNSIQILIKYKNKIDWKRICLNPNAFSLLQEFTNNFTENIERLNWSYICENTFAPIIFANSQLHYLIDWEALCTNPLAIDLIEKNEDKINYRSLCFNPNPKALNLLKKHIDANRMQFYRLNPYLPRQYLFHLPHLCMRVDPYSITCGDILSTNPGIVEFDSFAYKLKQTEISQIIYNL